METRWENRPVSISVAIGLLRPDMGRSAARSTKPCARDPPRRATRVTTLPAGPAGGRATANPSKGRPPHTPGHKAERGDAATSPLPEAGLAKLVLVTASNVTLKIHSLPTPFIWQVRIIGTGRLAGTPRSRVIRRSSSTVNPSGDRMPVPPTNPQGTQAAVVVLIAIAAWLCVAYWRNTLRIIIAVLIALAIYGAVAGIEGVTSVMTSHHR
jgi:hypothetical protein